MNLRLPGTRPSYLDRRGTGRRRPRPGPLGGAAFRQPDPQGHRDRHPGGADRRGGPPRHPREGPDEILVPSIKIKAPLEPIELASDGVLTPPADTEVVGWWDDSAEPGSGKGQTVVTGHTVSTGGGVMNDLPKIDVGALVQIRDEGKLVDYRTTGVFKLSKEQVADSARTLFGQGSGRPVGSSW